MGAAYRARLVRILGAESHSPPEDCPVEPLGLAASQFSFAGVVEEGVVIDSHFSTHQIVVRLDPSLVRR